MVPSSPFSGSVSQMTRASSLDWTPSQSASGASVSQFSFAAQSVPLAVRYNETSFRRSGLTTVTLAAPSAPSAAALMTAVPSPRPRTAPAVLREASTEPDGLTEATAPSSVVQSNLSPGNGRPSPRKACAFSCTIWRKATVSACGVTVTVTDSGATTSTAKVC